MNKRFCDICGSEIKGEDEVYENNIYIRIENDDKKFAITDACDDCITEFRQTFSRFIKEEKPKAKTKSGDGK